MTKNSIQIRWSGNRVIGVRIKAVDKAEAKRLLVGMVEPKHYEGFTEWTQDGDGWFVLK